MHYFGVKASGAKKIKDKKYSISLYKNIIRQFLYRLYGYYEQYSSRKKLFLSKL